MNWTLEKIEQHISNPPDSVIRDIYRRYFSDNCELSDVERGVIEYLRECFENSNKENLLEIVNSKYNIYDDFLDKNDSPSDYVHMDVHEIVRFGWEKHCLMDTAARECIWSHINEKGG